MQLIEIYKALEQISNSRQSQAIILLLFARVGLVVLLTAHDEDNSSISLQTYGSDRCLRSNRDM